MSFYILTLWQGIQRAEAAGYHHFAAALRHELATELLRTNQHRFYSFILSL